MWRDITYLVSDIFAQYSNPLKSRPALHFFLPRKLSKACTFPTAFRSCTLYSLVLFLRISSLLNCVSRLLFLRFQHKPKIFVLPNLVQKSQGAQQREASGSKSNIFFLILESDFDLSLGLGLRSDFGLSLSLDLGSDFDLSFDFDLGSDFDLILVLICDQTLIIALVLV